MLEHGLKSLLPQTARAGPELRAGLIGTAALVAFGVLTLLVREFDAPTALMLVLALGFAAPLVLRPELATLVVVFLLYTNIPVLATYHGVPRMMASSFLLLLGIPLAHYVVARRQPLRSDSVLVLMLVYLAVMLVSSVGAKSIEAAFAYVGTYIVEGLAVYWLILNTVRSATTLTRVIWTLVAAAAFLGALTTYQEVTGAYDQQFYGLAHRNVGYLELQALDPEDPGAAELIESFEGARNRRAEGPMNEPNRYAQILLVILPLALHTYRTGRSRRARIASVVAAVFILCGMVYSDSRGALVALVVLAMIAGYTQWIRRSHLMMAGLALVLCIPIVAPRYATRALSLVHVTALAEGAGSEKADGAIRGRATEMLAATQAFFDHSLLGVGPAQYLHFYSLEYQQKNPRLKFRDIQKGRRAHSLYPELAAELGVMGLLSFLAIFVVLLRGLLRAWRRWKSASPEVADLAAALVFSLLAYLITSAFLHLAYQRYLWLFVGLAGATLQILHSATRTERGGAA